MLSEEPLSQKEAEKALAEELQKKDTFQDRAKVKKLFRMTHRDRRCNISTVAGGSVTSVTAKYPLLKERSFVSI